MTRTTMIKTENSNLYRDYIIIISCRTIGLLEKYSNVKLSIQWRYRLDIRLTHLEITAVNRSKANHSIWSINNGLFQHFLWDKLIRNLIQIPSTMISLSKKKVSRSCPYQSTQIFSQLISSCENISKKMTNCITKFSGRSTKRLLTRILDGNILNLINDPLRSIGHFLHYHGLSCTDCSLRPRDCNFPAQQGTRRY